MKKEVKIDPKDYGRPMTKEEFEAKYGTDHGFVTRQIYDTEATPEEFEQGQRFVSRAGEDLPTIIVAAGVEGGGTTIYGRRVVQEDTPTWVFYCETTAMDLDDNDDEVWRTTRTEETPDLAFVCPASLFRQYPSQVHPEFAAWFRERWRAAMSDPKGSGEAASRQRRLLEEWDRVIAEAER